MFQPIQIVTATDLLTFVSYDEEEFNEYERLLFNNGGFLVDTGEDDRQIIPITEALRRINETDVPFHKLPGYDPMLPAFVDISE